MRRMLLRGGIDEGRIALVDGHERGRAVSTARGGHILARSNDPDFFERVVSDEFVAAAREDMRAKHLRSFDLSEAMSLRDPFRPARIYYRDDSYSGTHTGVECGGSPSRGAGILSRERDIDPARERLTQVSASSDGALLISSLTEAGSHAPAIDIDFAAERDGSRLVLRRRVSGDAFVDVLRAARDSGFVTSEYFQRRAPGLQRVHEVIDPSIELAAPFRLLPSTHHHHLYVDREVDWPAYYRLLVAMDRAGIIQGKFFGLAQRRGMTLLLRQGITKEVAHELTGYGYQS